MKKQKPSPNQGTRARGSSRSLINYYHTPGGMVLCAIFPAYIGLLAIYVYDYCCQSPCKSPKQQQQQGRHIIKHLKRNEIEIVAHRSAAAQTNQMRKSGWNCGTEKVSSRCRPSLPACGTVWRVPGSGLFGFTNPTRTNESPIWPTCALRGSWPVRRDFVINWNWGTHKNGCPPVPIGERKWNKIIITQKFKGKQQKKKHLYTHNIHPNLHSCRGKYASKNHYP